MVVCVVSFLKPRQLISRYLARMAISFDSIKAAMKVLSVDQREIDYVCMRGRTRCAAIHWVTTAASS